MKLLSTFFSSIACWIILSSTCVGQENSILYPFSMDRAQPGYRAGRFELFALGQYWNAEAFKVGGVRLPFPQLDPSARYTAGFIHTVGFIPGFGFAYNINNHFAVRSEFTFRHQDYIVQIVQSPELQVFQRGNAFVHEGKFNLDYNVLSSKFTPFVSVGVGYLYLGADDRTSFDAWHFDLNAAAGVRWDVTDHLFLKAYAGGSWANVDHPDWAATFQATVAAGWRF